MVYHEVRDFNFKYKQKENTWQLLNFIDSKQEKERKALNKTRGFMRRLCAGRSGGTENQHCRLTQAK